MPSLDSALRDFARVAKRGGEVRCTLPLAGTFQEFHDLYREVLIKHDKHEALERLEKHIARYPDDRAASSARCAMRTWTVDVEIEEFTLLFKSSREFFFAPVIEYGPLAEWKEIAGSGQEMQDVFWYIKEAIDAYFDGRPFQVTVKAGCLIGTQARARRPIRTSPVELDLEETPYDQLGDDAGTGLPLPAGADRARARCGSTMPRTSRSRRVSPSDGDFVIEESLAEEHDLDAFIEGKQRPSHLDGFEELEDDEELEELDD